MRITSVFPYTVSNILCTASVGSANGQDRCMGWLALDHACFHMIIGCYFSLGSWRIRRCVACVSCAKALDVKQMMIKNECGVAAIIHRMRKNQGQRNSMVQGNWRQEFIYLCSVLLQELFGTRFSPGRISGCISHNRTLHAWLIGGRKRQARCPNRNASGSMEY